MIGDQCSSIHAHMNNIIISLKHLVIVISQQPDVNVKNVLSLFVCQLHEQSLKR